MAIHRAAILHRTPTLTSSEGLELALDTLAPPLFPRECGQA
jgi:hypothetical protein